MNRGASRGGESPLFWKVWGRILVVVLRFRAVSQAVEEAVVEAPAPAPRTTATLHRRTRVPSPAVEAITGPVEIVMPDPADDETGFVHDTAQPGVDAACIMMSRRNEFEQSDEDQYFAKFRSQMETLKENESAGDQHERIFIKWKRGEINHPGVLRCALRFDDGWREVYTMAFPVLKEFEYPFTIFLYTKYLNIGGRSSDLRIRSDEMIADQERRLVVIVLVTRT